MNRYLYTRVHGSITHNSHEVEATIVSIKGNINQMWRVHIMKCNPVLKGKEIMAHVAVGLRLEDGMLNEISPSHKR